MRTGHPPRSRGCLPDCGVPTRNLQVGVFGSEGGAEDFDSRKELGAVSRWQEVEEVGSGGLEILEGGQRVASHGSPVESSCRLVEDAEGLREVGVEFE